MFKKPVQSAAPAQKAAVQSTVDHQRNAFLAQAADANPTTKGRIEMVGDYVIVFSGVRQGKDKTSGNDYFAVEGTIASMPEDAPHRVGDTITGQFEMMGKFKSYFFDAVQTICGHIVQAPGVKLDAETLAQVWFPDDTTGEFALAGVPLLVRAKEVQKSKSDPSKGTIITAHIIRSLTIAEAEELGLTESVELLKAIQASQEG